MTTIAANLNEMSADSFLSDGNRTVKLMKAPGLIVGYCGSAYYGYALAKWVVEGQRGAPPHPVGDDKADDAEVLILRRTGLSVVDGSGREMALDGTYAAIGSGSDVAYGAMWAGKTPEEAVTAAAHHDGNTKLPVHTIKLTRRK